MGYVGLSKRAGRLQCFYTEKFDSANGVVVRDVLRGMMMRWFPGDFAFITSGSLPGANGVHPRCTRCNCEPPRLDATSVGSSENADVEGAESEAEEVDYGFEVHRLGGGKPLDVPPLLLTAQRIGDADEASSHDKCKTMKRFFPAEDKLADAQAEGRSLRGPYDKKLAEEKMALLVQGGESSYRKAQFIEYDERKRGGGMHEKKSADIHVCLPATRLPGYNQNAYEELVAAMEAMKLLELALILHSWSSPRDPDLPIACDKAGLTLDQACLEGVCGPAGITSQAGRWRNCRARQYYAVLVLHAHISPVLMDLMLLSFNRGTQIQRWRLCHRKIVNFWGSPLRMGVETADRTKLAIQSEERRHSYLGFLPVRTYGFLVPVGKILFNSNSWILC
ncbi:hypothetical protein Tco_0175266 [Tanacetum coccineum]